jgi:hypothetical protein
MPTQFDERVAWPLTTIMPKYLNSLITAIIGKGEKGLQHENLL